MNSIYHTLIKTKLHPPFKRSQLIKRQRLIEQLALNNKVKLTLVAAPAGFGKTTLLGQWYEQLAEDRLCCWCSLDHEDNNATRFLRHIVGALRTCADLGADVIRQLDTTLIADISDVVPLLINDLSDCNKDITLVIDDFHSISSAQIHQFIELLIKLSPPCFHLIIASRIRPPLPLSSLRLRNELHEITANHLRFDISEAKNFMSDVVGLDLSARHLDSLYEHSEGWAAGLQLASLSLHDASRRDEFIASFSGNLRDIADYLTSDVLNQQSAEVRDFLLRTSILERLSAGACNALIGTTRAQELITQVESGNLFLVSLDNNNEWYRYHHLFQEFLRTQLRREYPEEMVALYKCASDWFADNGHINEAVNYALLGGDMNRVGHLIHSGSMEDMAMQGRMTELLAWVNSIPQTIKAKFPRLLMQECVALSHLSRPLQASDVARQVEISIKSLNTVSDYQYSEQALKKIHAEATAMPFIVAFCEDDIENMSAHASEVLESDDDLILGMAHNFIAYTAIHHGQLATAGEHLRRARFHHVKQGTYYGAVFSDCFMVTCCHLQFKLHDAFEHALAAEKISLNIDGGHAPALAKAKVMQALIHYEWNNIDEAVALLEANLPQIEKAGQVSICQQGYLTLARCHHARGAGDEAERARQSCLALSRHTNTDYISALIELELSGRTYSSSENILMPVEQDCRQIEKSIAALHLQWQRTTFAHLLQLFQRCFHSARADLFQRYYADIRTLLDDRQLHLYALKLQLMQAILLYRQDEKTQACQSLAKIIDIIHAENGARIMLETGTALLPLLSSLQQSTLLKDKPDKLAFVLALTKSLQATATTRQAGRNSVADTSDMEAVSRREIEILSLMAKGESNAAISRRLRISENTVKWHIKNLFAKLGVNNRTAAVVSAQQKSLII